MQVNELKTLLESSGLPIAYSHWPRGAAPPLPYVIFIRAKGEAHGADSIGNLRLDTYQIDLYTAHNRNLDAEDKLEAALDSAGIHYICEEDYLSEEDIYLVSYEMEFLIRR